LEVTGDRPMDWEFNVETDEFHPLTKYAKKFGVSIKTVSFWCDRYGLPHCQPGGQRFTTDEAFNAWLSERNGRIPEND